LTKLKLYNDFFLNYINFTQLIFFNLSMTLAVKIEQKIDKINGILLKIF